jgi:hypothetical protein
MSVPLALVVWADYCRILSGSFLLWEKVEGYVEFFEFLVGIVVFVLSVVFLLVRRLRRKAKQDEGWWPTQRS